MKRRPWANIRLRNGLLVTRIGPVKIILRLHVKKSLTSSLNWSKVTSWQEIVPKDPLLPANQPLDLLSLRQKPMLRLSSLSFRLIKSFASWALWPKAALGLTILTRLMDR